MNLTPWRKPAVEEPVRDAITYTLDEFMGYVNELVYNGTGYVTFGGVNQTAPGQRQEQIGPAYKELASLAYKSDGVVFACMLTRALHFSEARFQFRQMNQGRPGKLFGTGDLQPLEEPWSGGTTGDLLTRMLMYADLAGNSFAVRRGDGIDLLRPDWVSIIIGSDLDPQAGAWASDARVLGYVYNPGGYGAADSQPETFLAEQVAHFAPIPDPEARFRGMSWITPLLREIMADKAGTETKLRYWENPTPNLVVKFDVPGLDQLKEQIAAFKEAHGGARNAFKYMFGTMGMDATPVGSNMKDLDFKMIMGAGETRIAAAARTPPVLVGLSEGLQGSALNSGNYQAARRMFADGCIRPLWRNVAGSLSKIVTVPGNAELWYDDRDIAFLREDAGERAEVELKKAQTIRYLVDAGYKPDTVISAVEAEDFTLLEHSGLFSVQLQAANAPRQGLFTGAVVPNTQPGAPPTSETAATNGANGAGRSLELDTEPRVISPETHVHFDEGAFRFELPPAPDVHIHEGAFRAEIEAPQVHVDAPVTRFEEGAIQVEAAPAPNVEVNMDMEPVRQGLEAIAEAKPTEIRVDAPITVEPAEIQVTFPERAIQVEMPEQQPVVVNVPDQQPPVVNVTVPDQPAPVVNVNIEDEPLDAQVSFKRNSDGTLKSAQITETGDNETNNG